MITQKSFPLLNKDETENLKEELCEKYKTDSTYVQTSELIKTLTANFRGRVLDVGCANGELIDYLNQKGLETYGTDIENFLTKGDPVEFRKADLNYEKLPWVDGVFQGITAIEIYEHLENPFHFIRELARVLEQGGTLILTTPNPHHLFNKLSFLINGEFYRFSEKNDHLALLTMPMFRKCVLRYFDLIETHYWESEFPYRWLSRLKYPKNKYFGISVVYVLKKK